MLHWIVWFVSLFTPRSDAEALQMTAPTYLKTVETAAYHVTAARFAAEAHGVDENLVLSIAHHESRYSNARNPHEPGGLTSCGVMTPVPKKVCHSGSIADGYMEGAAHLRGWIDGPTSFCAGNMRCALLGYAGGYALIDACKRGKVIRVVKGQEIDMCVYVVWDFQSRAAWIRKLRSHHVSKRSGV